MERLVKTCDVCKDVIKVGAELLKITSTYRPDDDE